MNELKDKILGSMIGGAVGDALGYPVEFVYSYAQLADKYGDKGIKEYDTGYPWLDDDERHGQALFSDDTQMTLYTAEGLLYAMAHGEPILPTITGAYLHWLCPQIGHAVKSIYPSELIGIDELNQNRAPGNTCISALRNILAGKTPVNNSKGCGGIMRIAPIALYGASHGWSLEQTAKMAGDVAEITHLHEMSTLSAACCAAIIRQCALSDESKTYEGFRQIVSASLACIESIYPKFSSLADFKNLINKALSLHNSQSEDWQVIETDLGDGWVAEETLAIAVYSVARHLYSFEDCVVCAVNHGGDSDSTGAVAGNIIGAILGYNAIPVKYTGALQLKDLIERISNRLLESK